MTLTMDHLSPWLRTLLPTIALIFPLTSGRLADADVIWKAHIFPARRLQGLSEKSISARTLILLGRGRRSTKYFRLADLLLPSKLQRRNRFSVSMIGQSSDP